MSADRHEEFVVLMTRHQRQIWWFINSLLPAATDADDVLQETSLVLWRKWDQFDREREFVAWACGIARLQVFKFVRENKSKRIYLNEIVLGEIADIAQREIQNMTRVENRLTALKECVQSLTEPERSLIRNRYDNAWTTQRLAEELNRPLVTVYKTLARTRGKLSDCVNRKLATGEALN
jgi:RNA polymerase sigma-70 factor (ECF subfamily)